MLIMKFRVMSGNYLEIHKSISVSKVDFVRLAIRELFKRSSLTGSFFHIYDMYIKKLNTVSIIRSL